MEETKNILNYLQRIMMIDSPTGYTAKCISYVREQIEKMGFKTTVTAKGNLVVEIDGPTPALGICAHVDTLGLMVRAIKSNGTLSFTQLGAPQLPTLDGEYCKIYTRDDKVYTGTIISTSPASHVFDDARTATRDEKHMCVRLDEVVKTKEDVEALGINNGDIIAYDPKTTITKSGFVKSRFLDDKLSVAICLEVLEEISKGNIKPKQKTYFLISTYEEVGHGMAYIPSDIESILAIDMGCIGTDLKCTEYDVSICAKDSSGPYDYQMITELANLAKQNNISYAIDIYPYYSSDGSAALKGGNNIKSALIGPGVAASHGMERSHEQGIENTFKLIKAYLNK